ncbi:MAG: rhamnulokinase [Pyrinomonadaceae bacterium]|nr:rhamnulokinase [Pyrinomonadaceae bacterium]
MSDHFFIAIDLGAGSGRVFLGSLDKDFFLEELHRFHYPPTQENGHLRWNFDKILSEIKFGLSKASKRANDLEKKIYSIGVDSWAVDYGLIDKNGKLIENPICYRDSRTENAQENVFKIVPKAEIFDKTGIQFLNFNTIFQLFTENGSLEQTETILLLPDLINFHLTGKKFAEYSNATTTQLVNAKTGNWDLELLQKLDLDNQKLPRIISPGTDLGFLKTEIANALNLQNVRVIAPATHDTGSAVAGLPLEKDWAYISSGTWSLVGVELVKPLVNNEVAKFNFTNEGGVFGTIRFLKNVMGLWILESCRKEWEEQGVKTDYETLLTDVAKIEGFCGFIFPDDERFLNPRSMLGAIEEQLKETKQTKLETVAEITKVILDSLAFRYASVLETIENLTGNQIKGVQIAGGGGKNNYLNQMTANACEKKIKAGLTEATVTGNLLVQAISAGKFPDLKTARDFVSKNVELKTFEPIFSEDLKEAKRDYLKIEQLFLSKK